MTELIILAASIDIGTGSIGALIGAVIGGVFTYLNQSNKNSSQVEIAKINSSSSNWEKEKEELKLELKEMTESYYNIKLKWEKEKGSNQTNREIIKDYENLLESYRLLFRLISGMVRPKLEDDSEAMVLLNEADRVFTEEYKPKK